MFLAPLLRKSAGTLSLRDARRGAVLACRVETAFDSTTRRRGLLGRESLESGSVLVIAPCNAIHTFSMRFPIDVAFATREGRIVKVLADLRPWRIGVAWRAYAVLEFPAGTLARAGTQPGDDLVFVGTADGA